VKLKWTALDHEAGLYGSLALKMIYRASQFLEPERGWFSYIIPSGRIRLRPVIIDQSGDQPKGVVVKPESRRPDATVGQSVMRISLQTLEYSYLVERLVSAKRGSCSLRLSTCPISFQFCRSLLAWMGMPGKALKLEEAQKKVLSRSGTYMQLGSG
jgi:hypothetical protein